MIPLSLEDIATLTGGTLDLVDDPSVEVTGSVEFDSRKLTPGGLFVALPGLRVDGHDFAAQAIADGAVAALAARPVDAPAIIAAPVEQPDSNAEAFDNDPTGATASVLAAMSALARHVATTLTARGMTIIGVTGSAGKTSTKDMMASLFRAAGPTVAPPGSFNNEIGHPYTVLTCEEDTRYLVAELSARGVGHVAHLARIAPPRIGVVLNVGTAHLGEFGGREVIAQAKGELVEALPSAADGGVAVLNADDEYVAGMAGRTTAKVVLFSTAVDADTAAERGIDYFATELRTDEFARASFTLHTPAGVAPVTLKVAGEHQVANALAAAAAALEAGLPFDLVVKALGSHEASSAHRMDVQHRADGVTVINDSYNANPDSMRAGLRALARMADARGGAPTIAVLGQMGELGDAATEEHQALAEELAALGVRSLVAVGTGVHIGALAARAAELGIATVSADSADAAVNLVDNQLTAFLDHDAAHPPVVLVKASYAESLWRVAQGLLATG
ncbi:UDP-N-acetylmuramoyl-tripeptide--D-alanyl-D-alanine ligase [Corynebacterium sp. 13CS0277]|uniref:UDP-N-acetylmuramoyl-tripeptide--D-alanyl-D- alanine ligase n=1 Tax=Corynebacterium sp. 13CS0277 TaxID=2071994 RepID=UPI000D02980C|nr:UDP-N-acetylmuramoyl-tripeptide--D-alanyl-D-alanine ligase [Corynebacterium sp. 13CS0277]PRQ11149.1 UDP-N-acetylmuramoyl-tripeptide--D-alanyl-D-alanine ligase [Corynebacterium sp. 13CS0277]